MVCALEPFNSYSFRHLQLKTETLDLSQKTIKYAKGMNESKVC